MTTYTWNTNQSADWNTGTAWANTGAPGTPAIPNSATADVFIDNPVVAAGTAYAVTIAGGEVEEVNSLSINDTLPLMEGSNTSPYSAAELILDGTLEYAPGSTGALAGSLQTFIGVDVGANAEMINAGTIGGYFQVNGTLTLIGTNALYVTNDMQALGGEVIVDTSSIAEYDAATNTMFDGIWDAEGIPGSNFGLIELGGASGGLIVNVETLMGPPLNPGGWTELTFNSSASAIDEWTGSAYQPIENSLTTIAGAGTVDVLGGRDYTTSNVLSVDAGTGTIASGLLNLQAGTVSVGGLDINGGVVQGSAEIDGNVANNGTLIAEGGTMDLTGSLTGAGTVLFDIDNKAGTIDATGATLIVNAVSSGQAITMNGNDTLVLNAPEAFAGTVSAGAGDTIILNGITGTSAFISNGTLVVMNGTSVADSIALAGTYGSIYPVVNGSTVTFAAGTPPPPTISGTVADQAVTDETTVTPFSAVTIAGPSGTDSLTVTLSDAANGTLGDLGAGSFNATTGVYTDTGTAAALTADLDGLVFTPTAGEVAIGGTVTTGFTIAVTDAAMQTATDGTTSTVSTAVAPPARNFMITDTTAGTTISTMGTLYSGPVSGLTSEFVTATSDGLAVTATEANVFIHTGSGNDAIDVSKVNGNNVLDGSTGSNFLVGGTGDDTFFLDDRGLSADVFSTVVNFHSGDNATVWGITQTNFTMNTYNNQGAAGYTGLDFSFTAPGSPDANLVLTGFSSADLTNGKLTVTYGTTPTVDGIAGSTYMLIHAN